MDHSLDLSANSTNAHAAPFQSVCVPASGGCARCQPVPSARAAGTLLLGPQNADIAALLRHALQQAGITFAELDPVFILANAGQHLEHIGAVLCEQLPCYARDGIRAAYAPAAVATVEHALAAFVYAEPLAGVLAQSEHLWLRDAMNEGWLFSVFQPIVNLQTGAVLAHEALLRARNPHNGALLGAEMLIRTASTLNLMHQLDWQARQAAIRGAAAVVPPTTKVFINFMPNTIYDPDVCLRSTMAAAEACSIDPTRLVFEVVETERIADLRRLRRVLDFYRSRGVGTAIDDMGAGFTSSDYLAALQPDYVKIDRSLLHESGTSTAALAAFTAITASAHATGVRVIAEGVESAAHLRLCLATNVDYAQGYFFAEPALPPPPVHAAAVATLACATSEEIAPRSA